MAFEDLDAPIKPTPSWGSGSAWSLLILAAFLIYELTSQAIFSVAILCLKVGLEDFRTAHWLGRRDPVPARRRMEYWIFTSVGIWKVAFTAFLLLMSFAVVMGLQPNQNAGVNQNKPVPLVIEAMIVAVVGFPLALLTTWRAFGVALWNGRKIWLSRDVHHFRRTDVWPPIQCVHPNQANGLLTVSIGIVIGVVVVAVICSVPKGVNTAVAVILSSMLPISAVFILVSSELLNRRSIAKSPLECWKSSEKDSESQDARG